MSIQRLSLALLSLTLLATSCSNVAPEPATPTPELPPAEIPTSRPDPTETPLPPTATATPTESPTLTPTPEYPPEGFGPTGFPENVNPLTGLFVSEVASLERRPLAFKVNVVPRGSTRPPWGLSLADIVFDYYHNDGYSRFHAIFYGNDASLVGPIRSARLPDEPLVRMYKSIFAYGSADERINSRLFNSEFASRLVLEGGRRSLCPPTQAAPLCRHDPNGYDFLLGGTREIHAFVRGEGVEDDRQTLNGLVFRLEAPPAGEPGAQVVTRYSADSYNRWEYDRATQTYLRFQDDAYDQGEGERFAPLMDRLNDEQVAAANVVVLLAPHEYFQQPPAEIVEILLNGSGIAYAFRDGKVYELRWNRASPEQMITLAFPDGEPYPLKPGNTWFQVVGQTSLITQGEGAAWRFDCRIP